MTICRLCYLCWQRRHVDHKTIFDVALEHALVSLIDFIHLDQLDVRSNAMLGAEIKHLLSFLDATDEGTGQSTALEDQVEHRRRWMWRVGRTHQCHGAIALEQDQESIQVV